MSKAIYEKEYRSNKYDEKLMELLEKDIIMVKVDGEAVGEINGLSVIHLETMFLESLQNYCYCFYGTKRDS